MMNQSVPELLNFDQLLCLPKVAVVRCSCNVFRHWDKGLGFFKVAGYFCHFGARGLEDHEPYTSGCGTADESDCGRLSVLRNFGGRD